MAQGCAHSLVRQRIRPRFLGEENMALNISLYQLRTFQEVARLGSFTKAARNLGYPHP